MEQKCRLSGYKCSEVFAIFSFVKIYSKIKSLSETFSLLLPPTHFLSLSPDCIKALPLLLNPYFSLSLFLKSLKEDTLQQIPENINPAFFQEKEDFYFWPKKILVLFFPKFWESSLLSSVFFLSFPPLFFSLSLFISFFLFLYLTHSFNSKSVHKNLPTN